MNMSQIFSLPGKQSHEIILIIRTYKHHFFKVFFLMFISSHPLGQPKVTTTVLTMEGYIWAWMPKRGSARTEDLVTGIRDVTNCLILVLFPERKNNNKKILSCDLSLFQKKKLGTGLWLPKVSLIKTLSCFFSSPFSLGSHLIGKQLKDLPPQTKRIVWTLHINQDFCLTSPLMH